MNQICLPIEYPYRILSIFPTGSRRNQAGTKHRQHTRYRLRGHDSKIGFARCCQLTELLMFAQPVSHFRKSERAKMGAPIFQGCSRMFLIRDARKAYSPHVRNGLSSKRYYWPPNCNHFSNFLKIVRSIVTGSAL